MIKLLIDAATATDATKIEFTLNQENFKAGIPALKSSGLGSGDSIDIYEWVNGVWTDSGSSLVVGTRSLSLSALGTYSVDITMATVGPISCIIEASGRL